MRSCLFALLVAACSSAPPPSESPARPPIVAETPPTTSDPGAVQDRPPLQESTPDPSAGGSESEPAPGPKADGSACFAAADCASGQCEGEGCGPSTPGKCVSTQRRCTRDLHAYCGCDGKTFRSSGTCAGQRFSARTACP